MEHHYIFSFELNNGIIFMFKLKMAEWSKGSIKGVCARGGFEVSVEWKNRKITKLSFL